MGKSTDLVHLDKDTGELVISGRIDHEITPWLNMSVRATDSGNPPRSSFVDVFIQILDENDNNPYFIDNTVSNLSISEDASIGTLSYSLLLLSSVRCASCCLLMAFYPFFSTGTKIAVIEAKDADSSDYGKITYLLDRLSSQVRVIMSIDI